MPKITLYAHLSLSLAEYNVLYMQDVTLYLDILLHNVFDILTNDFSIYFPRRQLVRYRKEDPMRQGALSAAEHSVSGGLAFGVPA